MKDGSSKVLQDALVTVRTAMKEKGFRTKGLLFYRKTDAGNTVLLSLQKSQSSSASASSVAINYGVYSGRIGRKVGDEDGAVRRRVCARAAGSGPRRSTADSGAERWHLY
jgi:hypothetical protein